MHVSCAILLFLPTFSFSFGVFASGFLVCESKHGIGTMICIQHRQRNLLFTRSSSLASLHARPSHTNRELSNTTGSVSRGPTRACLDQLLITIRSFTLLCDQSRSQARLMAIMKLIVKLGIIYTNACHASLCTAALDCLSVSCHSRLLLYTNTARGGGGGDLRDSCSSSWCCGSV